jgi:hypothetical protein
MTSQRHFTSKHPLFRKTRTRYGVPWQESIYFLWWEFLRRHDGYKTTCGNGGKGRYAKLYKDFGNVHVGGFKQWWTDGDRGARLFGEPGISQSVAIFTKDDLTDFTKEWDCKDVLVLAAPLFLSKRFVQAQIARLIKKHHPRKRGERTLKGSKALYPLSNQFSVPSLTIALKVYDKKMSEPELKLWEIAQQLRFTSTLNETELAQRGRMASEANGKKNTMNVAVRRKLDLAEAVIDGVGKGLFPQYKT